MLAFSFFRKCTVVLSLFSIALGSADAYAQTVRVSNLSDEIVPVWQTGDPSIVQDIFVCVYRENSSGSTATYTITATGDGPGFFLKSGSNTLAYSLTWNDGGTGNPNGGTASSMVNNVPLAMQGNARIQTTVPTYSSDCNAGASPTAQLAITITNTNLDAAYDGVYTGTLTLMLAPS